MAVVSARALKVHREAAKAAIAAGPYADLDSAAAAIAAAVVEADEPTRWVVIVGHGDHPVAYGPYASAETARRAIDSGLMVQGPAMLLAMKAVPRTGHR
jgi:Xaa-Pro aminopeptidase